MPPLSLVKLALLSAAAVADLSSAAACPSWPFLAANGLPNLPPALTPALTAALSNINATLHGVLDPVGIPGFSFSVYYNGAEVTSFGGGVADKATGRRPDPKSDLFRIASNTKIFVSLLAVVFEELGFIASLDEPIKTYATDFKGPINTFNDGADITFRMLMSHMAGLPDSLPGNFDWSNITTAQAWASIASFPLTLPLNTFPTYSNLGISVLGHVLAEYAAPVAERGDIAPLLEKYVLGPLGLSANTGYTITPDVVSRLCPAYFADGSRVPVSELGWTAPCGTMWSTTQNIALFHQATASVIAGERISGYALSPSRARSWLQPVALMPDETIAMGQPWETFNVGGFIVRSKSGTLNGFATKSAVIPELRLSFAFNYNGNFKSWYTGNDLLANVTLELVPAIVAAIAQFQPPRPAGPSPADYEGTYAQIANPNNVATIALNARGELTISSSTVGSAVLGWAGPLASDAFRMYQDPTSDTCEHTVMNDIVWGAPLPFTREGGAVVSFMTVNWDGAWKKQ